MACSSASTSHDAYRQKVLALGRKIFLSYSGADHDFVYELYHDLVEHDYHPFFDQKSLPKGEAVSMGNIVQEAAHSKLAVFVLSEEFFTRNKNPMLELVECVEHGVRLLPLFYKISVDTIKSSAESWDIDKWTQWGVDRIKFKACLKTLLLICGIENKEGWRDRDYRRRVLQEIESIIPPDTLSDVSYIRGGDRLVKVVKDMFDKYLLDDVSTHPVAALGLYGASGTGKSSLCKILEHSRESLFDCQICCIELDNAKDKTSELARMKKILKSVSNLSRDFIDTFTDIDQVQKKLYEQECNKVFLIIDNVITSDSLEEAKRYLDARCRLKYGTKVLVTGHSEAVLAGLEHVNPGLKWHIAAMPNLKKEEAKQILLKRAGSFQVNDDLVERCLDLCKFRKGGRKGVHYHPLLLNALAESLADDGDLSNQEKMESRITSLELSFSHTNADAKEKVLHQMLKSTSYNSLNDLQKQVFLDVALYLPGKIRRSKNEILEWLGMVHGKNVTEVVWILDKRGLIDLRALRDHCVYRRYDYEEPLMHDLYYEMACLIVEEEGSKCLFIRGDGEDKDLPPLHSCQQLTRIRFDKCEFSGDLVVHHHFPSLQVLDLRFIETNQKLDLRGADRLHSLNLDISGDPLAAPLFSLNVDISSDPLADPHHSLNVDISSDPMAALHRILNAAISRDPFSQRFHIRDLDDCDSLCHLSIVETHKECRKWRSNITLPTFDFQIRAKRKRSRGHFPKLQNLILFNTCVCFDPPPDISSCTRIAKLSLYCDSTVTVLPTLTNLRVLFLDTWILSESHGPFELNFGHNIESIYIRNCDRVSALRGLDRNSTSLKELSLGNCPALKDFEFLGELSSLKRVSLLGLKITALPKQLLELGKQLQWLDISNCSFIEPQGWIAVLSTPYLPRRSYLQIISHLLDMHREIMLQSHTIDTPNPDCNLESWEKILSLLVESKEALDSISELILSLDTVPAELKEVLDKFPAKAKEAMYTFIRYTDPERKGVLAFVLYLCVGGRYMQLKELLSKPHVVRAFIEAKRPFALIVLTLAKQHFGVNIEESWAVTIATMVTNAYSEEPWGWLSVSCFKTCARECAAIIALSNTHILENLATEIRHQVFRYNPIRYNVHSSYDFTQELNYSKLCKVVSYN